ncbi:MAG: hypothetical protein V1928_01725 [Parcubacteria group bacterium]
MQSAQLFISVYKYHPNFIQFYIKLIKTVDNYAVHWFLWPLWLPVIALEVLVKCGAELHYHWLFRRQRSMTAL